MTMGHDPAESMWGCAAHRWSLLVALLLVLYGVNLLIPRDLWVQDEARYGEVVREMAQSGQWLVPHLNGHPYPDKPPLYFWIVAVLGSVLGHWELAFRLVTVLSTLATLVGVFLVGRHLMGATAGCWGAVAYLTALLSLIVGQIARMDMLLAAAAVFAWHALAYFRRCGSGWGVTGFWAYAALALAVKGPISLLFTVLPGLAWLTAERGWEGLRSLRPVTGVAALAAVSGAWMSAVWALGQGAYLSTIWHEQLVGRAVNSWSHREPVYFYLVLLPLLIMPWTGLAVRGALLLWRANRSVARIIALFTALPLVGLSLISGKLFIYLQPLLAGLCMTAGFAASHVAGEPRVSPWLAWPPVIFLVLLASGVGWFAWTLLGESRAAGLSVAAAVAALAVAGVLWGRCSGRGWLWGWVANSAMLSWLVLGALAYFTNSLFSARTLGEFVTRHADAGTPVAVVNTTRGILSFYAGRTMTELSAAQADAWLAQHGDGILILKTPEVKQVFGPDGIPAGCRIRGDFTIELKEYHVVGGC